MRNTFRTIWMVTIITAGIVSTSNADNWTIINMPGASETIPYGIDGNNVVGRYKTGSLNDYGFLYNGTSWTTLNYLGLNNTEAHDIDGKNIVGRCGSAGFLYNGSTWTILNPPDGTGTVAWGIDGNNIVGDYSDKVGNPGFLYNGTTWKAIDPPGAIWVVTEGIDGNNIVGYYQYQGSNGDSQGFLYNMSSDTWTILNRPGAYSTYLCGIDGKNIVGYYIDEFSIGYRGFIYDGNTWRTVVAPGAHDTMPRGIDGRKVVGTFDDFGFIYTIPESAPPIAVAGPNQIAYIPINGIAKVELNGSGSYDKEGRPLTYLWRWRLNGTVHETNGVNPTIELPEGQYTIQLVVNNGIEDSEPSYLEITVQFYFNGTYSGGSGSAEDPYKIGTASDWQVLMANQNDWDANFIMIADINLQGIPLTPVGKDIDDTISIYFSGVFDGNGYVIRNATITNRPGWHIGLFGLIDSNSQIKNLGVEDANMAGERDIAGLAGASLGTITNCYATGKIGWPLYPSANPGGLVGLNYGTIKGSHASCDVNGQWAGGLVGRNFGTVTDSYAHGTVYGSGDLGGLVGWNMGTIINSYADGEVNGATYGGNSVGGLVGENSCTYDNFSGTLYIGKITRCCASGSVSGYRYVGGLVGSHSYDSGYIPSITDCYSTSTVMGWGYVGGLLGINAGYTTNCYAAGKVTATQKVFPNTPPPGGGLISGNASSFISLTVKNCFWDINATDQNTSAGGMGKTTAEMMTLSTFTSAGWDFVNETVNGANDVWFIREGKEYPRLFWENNIPVADPGPNQIAYAWIDGVADITLDAYNSYDADGDALTYLWKWSIDGNTYESNDANLTLELPAGQYTFELVVNDGLVNSEPNNVVVTVVEPIKSTLWITPRIVDSGLFGQKTFMAIVQLPAGISKNQVDANVKLICYPGKIKASRQFVMSSFDSNRTEKTVIWAYFDSDSLANAVSRTGWVDIDVVSRLKTGQYSCGSEKVWVAKPVRKPVWHCPGYGWGW